MRRHLATLAGAHRAGRCEQGTTLVIALAMLIALLVLGSSAAHLALQNEKASRNDRDRQIALQATEAALHDAELDIEQSPDALYARSHLFSGSGMPDVPFDDKHDCHAGIDNPLLGLCRHKPDGQTPSWLTVDFDSHDESTQQSVPYGRFTGRIFPTGKGSLPSRMPRYVIEALNYGRPGESAEQPGVVYRITAVGYGARESARTMLQAYYRKEE